MESMDFLKDVIDEDTKKIIKYGLLLLLSLTLMVLSFMDIRATSDTDDQKTIDRIAAINLCSWIIIFLSGLILLRCLYFIYTKYKGEAHNEYEIVDKIIIFLFPLVIMVSSIVQKVFISSLLPDMQDPRAVAEYNKTHTVAAETVQGSSNIILGISIFLFVLMLIYAYLTKTDAPPSPPTKDVSLQKPVPLPQQMSTYDKKMSQLTNILRQYENEYNNYLTTGNASPSLLEDKELQIERMKVAIAELKASRDRNILEQKKQLSTQLERQAQLISATKGEKIKHIIGKTEVDIHGLLRGEDQPVYSSSTYNPNLQYSSSSISSLSPVQGVSLSTPITAPAVPPIYVPPAPAATAPSAATATTAAAPAAATATKPFSFQIGKQ